MRSNKKKAVDARELLVDALQDLRRPEVKMDFRGVAADTFDLMLNVLEHHSWIFELHAQFNRELRSRPMSISLNGTCQRVSGEGESRLPSK